MHLFNQDSRKKSSPISLCIGDVHAQREAIGEVLNDFKKPNQNKPLFVLKEIATIKYETAPSMPAIHTSGVHLAKKM